MFDARDFYFVSVATAAAGDSERVNDADLLDACLYELLSEARNVRSGINYGEMTDRGISSQYGIIEGIIRAVETMALTTFTPDIAKCVRTEFEYKLWVE